MHVACPSCGSEALEAVYEVRGIPTHSCLLMQTRDRALAYPTGDLVLHWCRDCGFACNALFDVSKNAYSVEYEEVQTFSPTFGAFQTALVKRLVEKHDIRDKDVVEIGCGKGEFLLELCDRGGNRGIGIDPSYVAGRGHWESEARVRFINELYSAERHGQLSADLIVCRHTLEHIQPTRELVRTVRRAIGADLETLVFFEIPDQERVYEACAFWDIYYEHCSYFTQGALERLFLACGFEVLDSWRGFGDQYLLIEARPLPEGQAPTWRVREDLAAIEAKVRRFAAQAPRAIQGWRERFEAWTEAGKRVVIWGAGSKGVAFLTTLGVGSHLEYAVDINPHKHGHFMPGTGHEVVSPEFMAEYRPDVVVMMNGIYREEIGKQLAEMGLAPELLAV
ncbi:MAG: class I SAM-dependent methyltransferase [Myxococcales bacterium]|nr:class I SAM-dependent methyltransferase [Myxococcales bacterium]